MWKKWKSNVPKKYKKEIISIIEHVNQKIYKFIRCRKVRSKFSNVEIIITKFGMN